MPNLSSRKVSPPQGGRRKAKSARGAKSDLPQIGPSPRKQHAGEDTASKQGKRSPAAKAKGYRNPQSSSADQVDEQLTKYRSMRDFNITTEPDGGAGEATAASLPFCIQKHSASHLHYDFRLGWRGVLKSWAVAKGPSYVVRDRRLAVQVEDHPMEYGGFEGIIPAGQYGGGTVMLWDQGTWSPQPGHEDVDAGLRDGSLKFTLRGENMHGRWTLVRMGGRAADERKPNWLLIKEHDEFERAADQPSVTETGQRSVATGRTMEEIAAQRDHVWNSKETAGAGQAWYRQAPATAVEKITGAPRAAGSGRAKATSAPSIQLDKAQLGTLPSEVQPAFIKPQLALEGADTPEGDSWLHEIKLDGYRMQARKSGNKVELLTRSGLDWTYRVPSVQRAVAALPVESVTLDGEVVVLSEDGTTNFARLQASFQEGAKNPLTFFCFDLLHLSGCNPRELPLLRRKELLAAVLPPEQVGEVRLSEHIIGNGTTMFHHACELHAEGIVSKLAKAPYRSGRSGDWLKSKCLHEQEFVIGGFTPSSDGPDRIGSLLIGYYRANKLIYAGRTGTGFTQKLRYGLRNQLGLRERKTSPFLAMSSDAKRDAIWVRPELVAQVRFASWTAEDLVRQAAFLGLREDKAASEVVREEAATAPRPKTNHVPVTAPLEAEGSLPLSSFAPKTNFSVRARRSGYPPNPSRPSPAPSTEKTGTPAKAWSSFEHPSVRLTHPSKILDSETAVTKQMLADFYWAVADRMLPHIAGRPLSLVRCPEGASKPCFYQKHVNQMLPPGIGSTPVPDKTSGEVEQYITLSSAEALAGLAQMGVLEIHPWGSRNTDLEHADRLIFDLDPDESLSWADVTSAATEVRDRLKKRKLTSFLKTTGGKGLHVILPIAPLYSWEQIKDWARQFVVSMERDAPKRYLTKMTKAARVGRIYLDYLRNERGATAVAPYSPRARASLGVSMPLRWAELDAKTRPTFRVVNLPDWRARLRSDPWLNFSKLSQKLL